MKDSLKTKTVKLTTEEQRAAVLLVKLLDSKVGRERDTAAFRFVMKGMGLWKATKSLVKKLNW